MKPATTPSTSATINPSGQVAMRVAIFLPGRGFVTFVGKGFDGVAAVQVSGGDVANDGVHVGSDQRGERQGIIKQRQLDIERRITDPPPDPAITA